MRLQRRQLLYIFPLGGLIALALLAYAHFIETDRLVVNHTTLRIKNWNPAFEGLKIVALSDIHGGSKNITGEKLRQIVATTNAQDADLVVLLGDFVSQVQEGGPITNRALKMPIKEIADGLTGFRAKLGVFAVLGNHDSYYSDKAIAAELTRAGITVLEHNLVSVERNGEKLRIVGLLDHLKVANWKMFSNGIRRIVDADSGKGDIIVLEHGPDVLPYITGEYAFSPDLKLILAGHTHGGQVRFPIFGTPVVPSSYGQKYSYGHIRQNDVDMFVTSGIGTSILPIRFMMPPEIAVLTILSKPPA